MPEFEHRGDLKKKYVREMFDDIAPRYDFLNHFLSLGLDFYWRRQLIGCLRLCREDRVLDVATGTGDVALALLRQRDVTVVGLDVAAEMLQRARQKGRSCQPGKFELVRGDGESLPFQNGVFQALTIAFGLRNIGYFQTALAEFYRVLKPGGQVAILEFTQPPSPLIAAPYRFYFHQILPRIGALFSRADAYRYLPESVDFFLKPDELLAMLLDCGFQDATFRPLTGGTVGLFSAFK